MTYFSTNLPELRKRAGYTQETLAEALGVSRQAVGKWESGQGLPEAATLLELADLLGCTLDQLMRQPLEETAPEDGSAEQWAVFSRHMDRFATVIALGVALVLLGTALTVAAAGFWGESPLIALPLLGFVTVAVFLFVFSGIDHGDFLRAYPKPPVCPDPAEQADFDAKFRTGMAGGVAGLLGSVALLVAASTLFAQSETRMTFAAAAFLALLSLWVGLIVRLGILRSKYDPAPQRPGGRDFGGAIMLTATALYLLLGFTRHLWHPGWVVFPIAGILCGVVESLQKKP